MDTDTAVFIFLLVLQSGVIASLLYSQHHSVRAITGLLRVTAFQQEQIDALRKRSHEIASTTGAYMRVQNSRMADLADRIDAIEEAHGLVTLPLALPGDSDKARLN